MNRTHITRAGAIVAGGFLVASAVANYLFGASLGRTSWEAILYGMIGVLAVAMNALSPFFLSWSLAASRRSTAAGIVFLWVLCLTYSTTSALGFAAQNRESVAQSRSVSREAYDDTRRELLDLEARRKGTTVKDRPVLDARIDDARKRLAALRQNAGDAVDAQSSFLSSLTFGLIAARDVRIALVALFALMVEVGATLGLFAALSHGGGSGTATKRWTPQGAR